MNSLTSNSNDILRFPIGRAPMASEYLPNLVAEQIHRISILPAKMRNAIQSVKDEAAWQCPYRPGGWTALEVLHHLPDSHLNAYLRFKFSLSESKPEIKPYAEELWVQQPDSTFDGIEDAIHLLEAVHARWVRLMRGMGQEQWMRTYYHPGDKKTYSLFQAVGIYAWHGEHHLAHFLNAIR